MKVTVISKATGVYREYWKQLLTSSLHLESAHKFRFVCFTDEPNDLPPDSAKFSLEMVGVSSLGWPGDSLGRYQLYLDHLEAIRGNTDLVLHLDADMLFRSDFLSQDMSDVLDTGIGLVQHPRFPKKPKPFRPRLRSVVRNVKNRWNLTHKGSWELSRSSSAFTPRKKRETYVAGGVWFSAPSSLEDFLKEVLTLIRQDESNSTIATWHDESYLNKWFSENSHRVRLLSQAYCHGGNPSGPNPIIEAVEKGNLRTR